VTQSPLPPLDLPCLARRFFTPPSPPGHSPAPPAACAGPSRLSHPRPLTSRARLSSLPLHRSHAELKLESRPHPTVSRTASTSWSTRQGCRPTLFKVPPPPVRGVPKTPAAPCPAPPKPETLGRPPPSISAVAATPSPRRPPGEPQGGEESLDAARRCFCASSHPHALAVVEPPLCSAW
jgi:hypothetical protein